MAVNRWLALLLAGLLAANAAVLSRVVAVSGNTLKRHPDWVLTKALLEEPVMGSRLCWENRVLLAHEQLNLGAYHGFQEVLLARPGRVEAAEFRFRLDPQASLTVVFDRNRTGFTGVHLSRADSQWFRADAEGGFLRRQPLAVGELGSGWHACQLSRGRLSLDAGPPLALPESPGETGCFGFRGSLANVTVDDVRVWEQGRLLAADDFRDRPPGLFWASLAEVTLLSWLVARLRAREARQALLWAILGNLLGLGLLLSYAGFDWYYWSTGYHHRNRTMFDDSYQPLELARQSLTELLEPACPPDCLGLRLSPYPPYHLRVHQAGRPCLRLPDAWTGQPLPPGIRVLVLGTSQTRGAGATRLEEAMLPRLAERLGPGYLVIDAAQRGVNSGSLLERYRHHLARLRPDLVVVSLGTNDGDPDQLEANLAQLAEMNRARGVRSLFVLEANSRTDDHLTRNHQAIRRAAQRYRVPLADLHGYLQQRLGDGLLWWDVVHPSSFGHRLAADFLAQAVLNVSPPASPRS